LKSEWKSHVLVRTLGQESRKEEEANREAGISIQMYFLENNHPPVPRLVRRDEKGSNGDGAYNMVKAQCKITLFTQCNVLLNNTALAHSNELFIAVMLRFKGFTGFQAFLLVLSRGEIQAFAGGPSSILPISYHPRI
jgi:hypothetical protein